MLWRWWRKFKKRRPLEIAPDEIFIDSTTAADFDADQFEGRIEKPLQPRTFTILGGMFTLLFVIFAVRAATLQVVQGAGYAKQAEENQLAEHVLFDDRGEIVDRTGVPLAYNDRTSVEDDFAKRIYASFRGLGHVVGYVKVPATDSSGRYYRTEFIGMDGVEQAMQTELAGQNGVNLAETDAKGRVVSQSIEQAPTPGQKITLSIDAKVTQGLYDAVARIAEQSKFQGGAGVLMDVHTGEILAMTSYPEYESQALSDGDRAAITALNQATQQPFLNRAVDGLYSPGSIIKPLMATAALSEGVIDENKQILSTGSISIPNPYDSSKPTIFKDWRVNGWTDVRQALAVSSDVYFYAVGGGYQDQPGLGIERIDKYLRLFGWGASTGLEGFTEPTGSISSPAWKEEHFPGDPWRLGNTYHTSIGQYGTQVTPLQAVRAIAAIANGGSLLTPTLLASSTPKLTKLGLSPYYLQVVREGMRMGVTEGIAQAVNVGFVHVAAKTGTAQVGARNEYLNSWMVGFFPFENPRYAYAIVLERGPAGTLVGASAATGQFLNWLGTNAPQYIQ